MLPILYYIVMYYCFCKSWFVFWTNIDLWVF